MSKGQRHQLRPAPTGEIKNVGPLRVATGTDAIEVDLSRLEAPSVEYDADFAWGERVDGTASLFFGKRRRDDPKQLLSRLEIRMSGEDAWRMFSGSTSFITALTDRSKSWPPSLRNRPERQRDLQADRSHSQWASYLYIAFSGSRAVIDAYELSVPGLARYIQSQKRDAGSLKFRSVVRVQLSVFDLLPLLSDMADFVPTLYSELRASGMAAEEETPPRGEEGDH